MVTTTAPDHIRLKVPNCGARDGCHTKPVLGGGIKRAPVRFTAP